MVVLCSNCKKDITNVKLRFLIPNEKEPKFLCYSCHKQAKGKKRILERLNEIIENNTNALNYDLIYSERHKILGKIEAYNNCIQLINVYFKELN